MTPDTLGGDLEQLLIIRKAMEELFIHASKRIELDFDPNTLTNGLESVFADLSYEVRQNADSIGIDEADIEGEEINDRNTWKHDQKYLRDKAVDLFIEIGEQCRAHKYIAGSARYSAPTIANVLADYFAGN